LKPSKLKQLRNRLPRRRRKLLKHDHFDNINLHPYSFVQPHKYPSCNLHFRASSRNLGKVRRR
jgi:hypothetical protein